jgi:hypothetical protein
VIASRKGIRADRTAVILTPDQRVRVLVSSTLGEPAGTAQPLRDEPGGMLFAKRMTQLGRQDPGLGYGPAGTWFRAPDELQTHRACRPHLKICGGQATSRASPQTQPAAASQRRRHPRWSMALRTRTRWSGVRITGDRRAVHAHDDGDRFTHHCSKRPE